jgi:hypothetical protein
MFIEQDYTFRFLTYDKIVEWPIRICGRKGDAAEKAMQPIKYYTI